MSLRATNQGACSPTPRWPRARAAFSAGAFGFQPANAQALALAQGVKAQAHMLANGVALVVFDRAGLFADVAV